MTETSSGRACRETKTANCGGHSPAIATLWLIFYVAMSLHLKVLSHHPVATATLAGPHSDENVAMLMPRDL